MIIRPYCDADEQGWLRCRVFSFLDCSYWNDVKTQKECYSQPSISLVAEDNDQIIGLLDIELNSEDLTCQDTAPGAVLWHLAVLPEYRSRGIATQLWVQAEKMLLQQDVKFCEVWTQEDVAANRFYEAIGFEYDSFHTWLRCYARWGDCWNLLDQSKLGEVYGAEDLIFQAPFHRKDELKTICYRIDEVRLYRKKL